MKRHSRYWLAVGPALREKLAARGLLTLQDLWLHLPRSYEDRTQLTPMSALRAGIVAQTEGRVELVERSFRGRPVLKVVLVDAGNQRLDSRFFHFRAQQVTQFAKGVRAVFGTAPKPVGFGNRASQLPHLG